MGRHVVYLAGLGLLGSYSILPSPVIARLLAEDGQNALTPVEELNEDAQYSVMPVEYLAEDGQNPEIPVGELNEYGQNPAIPFDEFGEDGQYPVMPVKEYPLMPIGEEEQYTNCQSQEFGNANGKLPFFTIGSITALLPEAADAEATNTPVVDGQSGDIDFPHGDMKPLATVGETDPCTGQSLTGALDGHGAYLVDDDTVRVIVQSESYGGLYDPPDPISYSWFANRYVSFTGSHVHHIDYDRKKLSNFMRSTGPASKMVKRFGNMIRRLYNVKGELVGRRNRADDGREPTKRGALYSNTDVEGRFVLRRVPPTDWIMMSLCSASLAERHQWGPNVGLEDDIFFTSEEQTDLAFPEDGGPSGYVGLHNYAIEVKTKTAWALGSLGASGYEKVVELNSMHPDYTILSISGYNGPFQEYTNIINNRNNVFGNRSDGKPWVRPENIVPARIYIGKKGLMEDGSPASPYDFLARNGLRFGRVYGFAIDMSKRGPTAGMWRSPYHIDALNGQKVEGLFLPTDWRWNGTVTDFVFDQAWDFQEVPPGFEGTPWRFWTGEGPDEEAVKMEHNSADPRRENSAFIQTAGEGYYGIYYLNRIKDLLSSLRGGELPAMIESDYFVLQGVRDITSQISLNGKGQYSSECAAPSALFNCDRSCQANDAPLPRLNDIDGFEIIHTKNNQIHAILDEDSSSRCGERMFLTGPITNDGIEIEYNFVGMSGGRVNSRGLVGVPARTATTLFDSHEFSGAFDASGLLAKTQRSQNYYSGGVDRNRNSYGNMYGNLKNPVYGNEFILRASDPGYRKRELDSKIHMNDKLIIMTLQAHNVRVGLIERLQLAEGGHLLAYWPNI